MRESALVARILSSLNARPNTVVRKLHGDRYAVAGDPDVYGCIAGRHLCLEVKRPARKGHPNEGLPTPIQWARLTAWQRAGSLVAVVQVVRSWTR